MSRYFPSLVISETRTPNEAVEPYLTSVMIVRVMSAIRSKSSSCSSDQILCQSECAYFDKYLGRESSPPYSVMYELLVSLEPFDKCDIPARNGR